MKKTISTILLFCALPVASFAQRGITVGWPHDDPNARREVYGRTELKPLITSYNEIIKTRIAPLKAEGIAKVFGPRLDERQLLAREGDPTNSAAPVFAPYSLSFSGLLIEDKSHRDLYAVGTIGYVEFFYELDGSFKTALLYARLDDKFVPLQSTNDFSRRLEWDKTKFDAIKKWFDTHPVPTRDATVSPNASKESGKQHMRYGYVWAVGFIVYGLANIFFPFRGLAKAPPEQQARLARRTKIFGYFIAPLGVAILILKFLGY